MVAAYPQGGESECRPLTPRSSRRRAPAMRGGADVPGPPQTCESPQRVGEAPHIHPGNTPAVREQR